MSQLLTGFILAAFISALAYKARSLTKGGAAAACGLGTVIFGLGGWAWAVLLLAFFISSSALSRLAKRKKAAFDEKFAKGSQRDAAQVAANGGVAGLCVLLYLLFPGSSWPWIGAAAALAAANADTWATELGVLSSTPPRLITSGKIVERGASGGVSAAGLLAALGGAGLVAAGGVIFFPGSALIPLAVGANVPLDGFHLLAFFLLISLAGLAGSLVDSLLGATWQAIYYCPACQKETERHPLHSCGTSTILKRGLVWMDNDWVNLICTFSGAIFAVVGYLVI